MSYEVIITDSGFPDHEIEREILHGLGAVTRIDWYDEAMLIEKTRDADALLVQWATITEEVIRSLRQCKVIVRYGIGVDNVDLNAARRYGIPVCNVPDYCITEVADHTVTMALSALRQVAETDRRVRDGQWRITPPRAVAPFSSLCFGLVGFGRIAREVAQRARAIGFRVAAYDPNVGPEAMRLAEVDSAALPDLLQTADILSLHLPLTQETHHFLNRENIRLMKSSALIVNTSRGGLVDSEALAEAISESRLWGAALDVFETEPLPREHVLCRTAGVLLSSHTAWYSTHSIPQLQRKAAEEVRRALRGERLQHIVNM